MTRRRVRVTRPRPRETGAAPALVPASPGPGDALVRALVTCLLQAHARSNAGRPLD